MNDEKGFTSFIGKYFRHHPEFGALVGLVIVFIGFSLTATRFLTVDSFAGIVTIASELGIVAAGVTFLMIAGEFDLSVGSVFGFSSMLFAVSAASGIPLFISLLIALLAAAGIGFLNGYITVHFQIPSFITTLGSQMLWRGVLLAITGGFSVRYKEASTVLEVLNSNLWGEFRTSAIWFFAIILLLNFILLRTQYGNATYATGGNKDAARILGISVNKVKIINFIICSVLAGLAGCIQFARFGSVDPVRGQGMELEAIAAVVVGGTLMTGGYGNLVGTLLGVLLIGMLRSGLIMAGAPAYWYQAFVGLILIIAVILNTNIKRWSLK
jgi:simple sugar transport system permease protein